MNEILGFLAVMVPCAIGTYFLGQTKWGQKIMHEDDEEQN